LNATYGSPFRKVASRIFVGWAVSLHVVDNGLPFRPRPLSSRRTRSRPQQFLIPSTLATRWTWGKESWEDGDGLRSLLERRRGCSAFIPAARFRSQFSRALTRLLSLPHPRRSFSSFFFTAYPLPSLFFLLSSGAGERKTTVERKLRKYSWLLTDRRIVFARRIREKKKSERKRRKRLEKVEERGCSSISYSQTRLIWKYNSSALSQYRVTLDERIVFWFMSRYFADNVSNDPRSIIRDLKLSDFIYSRKTH